jgi:transcriptional regulator with XRE-family HTH domain
MNLSDMSIGDRIRLLRVAKKMKQAELARAIGVNWRAVSLWELGKVVPSKASRVKLERVLGPQIRDGYQDRKQRISEARDKALERAIEIYEKEAPQPSELNAAINTVKNVADDIVKAAAAPNEEFRQLMRGVRERFRRKLARYRVDKS